MPPLPPQPTQQGLWSWDPLNPDFDALCGPDYQPQLQPPQQLAQTQQQQPDLNAALPDLNVPLPPLSAFNLFNLSPFDDANFSLGLDWMAAPVREDPFAEGGDAPRDREMSPPRINPPPPDSEPPTSPRINPPPPDEDDGEGPERGKNAREPTTQRTRASGPSTPPPPLAKQARPKPKPMYGGRRRAAEAGATSSAPQIEGEERGGNKDGEGGEAAEEGGGNKDGEAGETAEQGGGKKDGGNDRGEEEPEEESEEGVWQEDTSQWPDELRNAFAAFARAKSWGGEQWERCVMQLIALERVWGFPSKGLVAAPNSAGDRPKEIPDFMQSGRKWKSTVDLQSVCGPARLEESFGSRWWEWWGTAQPGSRRKANGELGPPHDVAASEWEEIGKMAGRNGLLLFLGGLLWWGGGGGGGG